MSVEFPWGLEYSEAIPTKGVWMKIASLVFAMFVVVGCTSPAAPEVRNVNGTVGHSSIEGGFFYILGDDGIAYTPVNKLMSCFQRDGLRVQATLKIRNDLVSYVPGTLVDVESIRSPGLNCDMLGK